MLKNNTLNQQQAKTSQDTNFVNYLIETVAPPVLLENLQQEENNLTEEKNNDQSEQTNKEFFAYLFNLGQVQPAIIDEKNNKDNFKELWQNSKRNIEDVKVNESLSKQDKSVPMFETVWPSLVTMQNLLVGEVASNKDRPKVNQEKTATANGLHYSSPAIQPATLTEIGEETKVEVPLTQKQLVTAGKFKIPEELLKLVSDNMNNKSEEGKDNSELNAEKAISAFLPSNAQNNSNDRVLNQRSNVKESLENQLLTQVIKKVQLNLKPGQSEVKMRLQPEHLGELQMNLTLQDGKVTAQFLTANQEVKENLESNLPQLKQGLQDQGIKVEKLTVLIAGGDLHFNQGRKNENFTGNSKSGRNWRKIDEEDYGGVAVEAVEKVRDQIISSERVDYTA